MFIWSSAYIPTLQVNNYQAGLSFLRAIQSLVNLITSWKICILVSWNPSIVIYGSSIKAVLQQQL